MQISENGTKTVLSESDENTLSFLDSMERYLILVDSLSSVLRQGWFELASARQSMGSSRVSSALFDLKSHHASTTVQVHHQGDGGPDNELHHFRLTKWKPSDGVDTYTEEAGIDEGKLLIDKSESPLHQHYDESHERSGESCGSPITVDTQAEKEKIKSLSVFGKLVSPKLRATQSSFEKALEMLVEISNVRASLLCAHDRVQKDLKPSQ